MLIRAMNENDLTEVLLLGQKAGLSDWGEAGYRAEMENSDTVSMVAVNNDNGILGFIFMRLITAESTAEILNIAVQPEYRKQNIGNHLLSRVKGYLLESGFNKIWLEVRESNQAAIAFYLKCGFKYQGLRKNYYRQPPENALLFSLDMAESLVKE